MNSQPAHILIVEDNEQARTLLEKRLKRAGYIVSAAVDGRETRGFMIEHKFDLILLDVMLPDVTGTELLAEVRQEYWPDELPVIMVTALDSPYDVVNAIKMGANDYVTKPVNMAVLIARAEAQIARKRAVEALALANAQLEERVEERTADYESALDVLRHEMAERMEIEANLGENEELVRLLLGAVDTGIHGIDLDGNCLFINEAGARLLGYARPADAVGQNIVAMAHVEPGSAIQAAIAGGGHANATDERVFRVDGSSFPASCRVAPFHREEQLAGFVVAFNDISEERQSQARMIHASKLVTLGEMTTAIAHELAQPMSGIATAAEQAAAALNEGEIDRQAMAECLRRIVGQAERSSRIIDHMRVFGRVDAGACETINLRDVVRDALDMVGELLKNRGIAVIYDTAKRCRAVSGHKAQLEQVVINLIGNARDAIEERVRSAGDGVPVPREITLSVVDDVGPNVLLHVDDTGGGIPDDIRDRIFEPFFTTKPTGKGTGLGLSVSYGIVSDMGGRLEASRHGAGTRMTISLPAVPG